MNHELAKTLATALVQFIDRERPEGIMGCSDIDYENIRAAFEEGEYEVVEAFVQMKLSRLTEFEKALRQIIEATLSDEVQNGSGGTMSWAVALSDDDIKKLAPRVLAIAKNELLSFADKRNPAIEAMADLERTYFCNPDKLPEWLKNDIARKELNAHTKGYNKGYKDAEKQYNESVAYHYDDALGRKHLEGYIMGREDTMREMKDFLESHFNTKKAREGEVLTDLYRKEYERNPEPVPTGVAYKSPQCYTDVMVAPNINSGTSTLKAEG